MNFFIDKQNRRKSPVVLLAFGIAVLEVAVFGVLYAVLSEPLYRVISLGNETATTVVHTLIIAALGTLICCLLFFLPDKRIAPYSFFCLAAILCMFYAAAILLDQPARSNMIILITMFGLAPVLVGNAAAWPIYLKIKRSNPALNHKKTIQQELREAIEKENACKERKNQKRADKPEQASDRTAAPAEENQNTNTFGPEFNPVAASAHTAEEEAVLLYMSDEESDD